MNFSKSRGYSASRSRQDSMSEQDLVHQRDNPRDEKGRRFAYVYFWHRMGRKNHRCAVLARGSMNSCLVEFEDGFKAVTSRNALRKYQSASATNL